MGDEQTNEPGQVAEQSARQRTAIPFPYTDLTRAIELNAKIAELGGREVELTQLAAALNQTADGGTFRGRISAARMFGLIEYDRMKARLTGLDEDVLDPNRSAGAKVTAFLKVPLYQKLYEQYQGYPLPHPAAIQRQMAILGLPQKQVERARQAFVQSIQEARFVNSNGRFVKPIITGKLELPPASDPAEEAGTGTIGRDDGQGGGASGGGDGGGGGETPLTTSQMLLELLDPEKMTDEETKAVWTLLLYVKKPKKTAADQS
jgi:hypothetical protein